METAKSDWILGFLSFVPGHIETTQLRLMKGLFLVRMESEKSGSLPEKFYSFEPYLFGPCSFPVYTDLADLVAGGFVSEERAVLSTGNSYRLTSKGSDRGKEFVANLDPAIRGTMQQAAKIATEESITGLLQYVYSNYPKYAENSILSLSSTGK